MTTRPDAAIGTGELRRLETEPLRTTVQRLLAAVSPADGPDVLGIEVLGAMGTSSTTLRVLATLRAPVSHAIMRVPVHVTADARVG
jgi:hypothetical protein